MTKHTAAQPLDLEALDKLEALARAATPGPWASGWPGIPFEDAVERIYAEDVHTREDAAFIAAANPATVLALIAQARAAQPESATGTTGTSIDTPEFRELLYCLDHTLRRAWASRADDLIAHIDAIIGDLRAQLAAKGQGNAVAYMVSSEGEPELGFWFSEEPGGTGQISEPLYLGAPASAQPDRGEAREETLADRVVAWSAERAASPASQPVMSSCEANVAPSAELPPMPEPSNLWGKGYNTDDMRAYARAALVAATAPSDAKPNPTSEVFSYAAELVRKELEPAVQLLSNPSDAKGQSDAANAGDIDALVREYGNAPVIGPGRTRRTIMSEIYQLAHEIFGHHPATSAADAKDAARYRWLRDQDIMEQIGRSTPYVVQGQTMHMLEGKQVDDAVDAAMAAAPSSEKGGAV